MHQHPPADAGPGKASRRLQGHQEGRGSKSGGTGADQWQPAADAGTGKASRRLQWVGKTKAAAWALAGWWDGGLDSIAAAQRGFAA